jgi:hypothetical protein
MGVMLVGLLASRLSSPATLAAEWIDMARRDGSEP